MCVADNPCPHLGNIVTIKLSEDQETVLQPDDTSLTTTIETHFHLNYNSGEWKSIKKPRKMQDPTAVAPASTPLPAASAAAT
jgi:negative elongation factor A